MSQNGVLQNPEAAKYGLMISLFESRGSKTSRNLVVIVIVA